MRTSSPKQECCLPQLLRSLRDVSSREIPRRLATLRLCKLSKKRLMMKTALHMISSGKGREKACLQVAKDNSVTRFAACSGLESTKVSAASKKLAKSSSINGTSSRLKARRNSSPKSQKETPKSRSSGNLSAKCSCSTRSDWDSSLCKTHSRCGRKVRYCRRGCRRRVSLLLP